MADPLGMLLHEVADQAPAVDPDDVDDEDWVEDHLEIIDAEPGKIWFETGSGRSLCRERQAISPAPAGRRS